MDTVDRFWMKVKKSDGCWEWLGCLDGYGYGKFNHNGVYKRAHRLSWELVNGPIPEGFLMCHKCDNPPCVRPDHMFVGTHQDNSNDAIAKGRRAPAILPGEKNGNAKLTYHQAAHIRAQRQYGISTKATKEMFGISSTMVERVRANKTYRVEV